MVLDDTPATELGDSDALLADVDVASEASIGKSIRNRMEGNSTSPNLPPSPHHMSDDTQYLPASSEFKHANEARVDGDPGPFPANTGVRRGNEGGGGMSAADAGAGMVGGGNRSSSGAVGGVLAPGPGVSGPGTGVRRDIHDRAGGGESVTVGLATPGNFSADIDGDNTFRLDSFTGQRPTYGGVDPTDLESNTEAYNRIVDNLFLPVGTNPLSTFSIDVDTASYSNVRRYLMQHGQRPPKDAVRIEELVNYFPYRYAPPQDGSAFAVHTEVAECPWHPGHRLVRIGLKGREVAPEKRPATNLVFLLDVSGSMDQPNKLPLVKQALRLLVGQLSENDRVAIAVYAGASGLVLPTTTGDNKDTLLAALDRLQAGGSTNGAQGIELAYELATAKFIQGGVNRVILATDGDFNVGITDDGALTRLIEDKAKSGVFLSVLGFGMGNVKDARLEQLADRGNGHYAYIDTEAEARKVFVDELGGTLVTIAKDVKIQVEFNPARVAAFRLIGYENRVLRHEDFNDDRKDAGEIGAGHTVTALYEIVPAGDAAAPNGGAEPVVEPLKYQKPAPQAVPSEAAASGELLTVKLRYKEPDGQQSKRLEYPLTDVGQRFGQAGADFQFAAAVAAFGMLLRDSEHKGNATFDAVLELAEAGRGPDEHGHRAEFIELVKVAKATTEK